MVDKNPITDKTLGIPKVYEKFAEVRQKARDEFVDSHKKAKRNKQERVSQYKPGDIVVLKDHNWIKQKSHYYMIEIIDFEDCFNRSVFKYYGILLKTTNSKSLSRIGRLVSFGDDYWGKVPANVPPESIKWERKE